MRLESRRTRVAPLFALTYESPDIESSKEAVPLAWGALGVRGGLERESEGLGHKIGHILP